MLKCSLYAAAALALAVTGPANARQVPDPPNSVDRQFIATVGRANTAEIALSRIALVRTHDGAIRHFAAEMLRDHTVLGAQFAQVVAATGGYAPTRLDAEHRAILRTLRHLSGSSFDQIYMSAMVTDHTEAVNLFQEEIDHGQSSHIRNFALRNVGMIQGHLQMAGDIVGKLTVANRIKTPLTNKM
jgi:putative membrane protein